MSERPGSGAFVKYALQVATGIAIGILLFWLALRGTNIDDVKRAFAAMSVQWVVVAVGLYFLALFIRTIRWWLILRGVTDLRLSQVGVALLVGYAVNALLAARLGELFRADYCRRYYRVSRTKVIGTIMIERFSDGIIVLIALGIGILSLNAKSSLTALVSLLVVGSLVFASLGAFMFLLGSDRVVGQLSRLFARFPFIATRFGTLSVSLRSARSPRMIGVFLISFTVWFCDGGAMWAILRAAHVDLGFFQLCLVIGVVSLSTLLPSPPGFLGTMQYAFVLSISFFGYSSLQGLVAATGNQVFLIGSMVIVGSVLLAITFVRGLFKSKELSREPVR